jgi:hypothetical protein
MVLRLTPARSATATTENQTMPLDALPYADLMERLGFIPANHREAQLFAAETRPVYDERGQEVADFRRIVRTDNDKTLEVVGARLVTATDPAGMEAAMFPKARGS